jgi:pyrimidine deaminase RibD-like protein
MILNDFTAPRERFGREKLDAVLAELCGMVEQGQQENPDFYGMVAAAVLDPTGRLATGVNYLYGNGRVHAERAAIDSYEEEYGELPRGSIVITTLSPCSQDTHDNRHGESCTDFLNSKRVKMAYCGYQDPTQEDRSKFTVIITQDAGLEELCKQFADSFLDEDYDPNGPPPGPEFPPTMPAGTVKVDVSDVYDWYKLGQHVSNLKGLGKHDFGQGPPSAIMSFGSEPIEHKYIKDLEKTGLTTTDIDPKDPKQPKGMKRQKVDPRYNVSENFADGKNPGRKGLAKRSGVNTKASVSSLRKTAKNSTGEKQRMAHWMANMKAGKKKKANENKSVLEIQRIPVGDFGDADTLISTGIPKNVKPLPGGSGYKYAINDKGSLKEIMIFDGKKLVAELDLKPTNDPINSWQVATVATQPDYRGKGLGQSLYGIALSILKLTLRAGKTQTKHGREMWLKLNNIPGVEVQGITATPKSQFKNNPNNQILWDTGKNIVHTFPITGGATSMKSAQPGKGLYNNTKSSMIARWTGK